MSPHYLEFHRAHIRAVWGNRLSHLRRRPTGLLSYREIRNQFVVKGESYRGIRTVPIDRIVGSTDRCHDFDTSFRPLRTNTVDRWVRVASGYAVGHSLPPVQLYLIADAYFVRDGHHRDSVARVSGRRWVDAEVIEVLVLAPLPSSLVTRRLPTTSVWTSPDPVAEITAGMVDRTRVVRSP